MKGVYSYGFIEVRDANLVVKSTAQTQVIQPSTTYAFRNKADAPALVRLRSNRFSHVRLHLLYDESKPILHEDA
jgi:hypothetical protein